MADRPQPVFSTQRIYLKDASYEAPSTPGIFLAKWEPDVNVEMDNSVTTIDESGIYDVQLKVTVTATTGDDTAYIAEVVQGGVFLITGFSADDRQRLTGSVCPDILYPYVREALSSLMSKGSFPPFLLNPVNFDYLYSRRMQDKKSTATSKT